MNPFFAFFFYGAAVILTALGFIAMMSAGNLMRKVIGLTIVQNALILFFISLAYKKNSSIPIVDHHTAGQIINANAFANPLPHALMLTAIVVGVSTLGVALALCIRIFRHFKTLEEAEILTQLKAEK